MRTDHPVSIARVTVDEPLGVFCSSLHFIFFACVQTVSLPCSFAPCFLWLARTTAASSAADYYDPGNPAPVLATPNAFDILKSLAGVVGGAGSNPTSGYSQPPPSSSYAQAPPYDPRSGSGPSDPRSGAAPYGQASQGPSSSEAQCPSQFFRTLTGHVRLRQCVVLVCFTCLTDVA